MIRPVYTLRDVEPRTPASGSNSKWWSIVDPSRMGSGLRFTMGLAVISSGAFDSICPHAPTDDQREMVCMILKGRAHLISDGIENILNEYDCVYSPSGPRCLLKNAGADPVYYLWAASLLPHRSEREGDSGFKIVHALQDQGEETPVPDGHSHWRPINSLLTGSSAFDLSLVTRPQGWSGPLHSHQPPDAQEAFMTLDGELMAVDDNDARYTLEEYDCVFIPSYTRHQNRNAGDRAVTFVVIGSPANITHAP